jgi:WD40 repeat protein
MALVNGTVQLFNPDTGTKLAEIGAHSRQINGLACHPSEPVFATCGDDTFMNVWRLGLVSDKLDVHVASSSWVPDLLLTGIAFAGKDHASVVCSVYDYKQLIVWD